MLQKDGRSLPKAAPRNKAALRRLWFKVHKWLGLALAVPVLLIFLSGSLLVWKDNLDALMHPRRIAAVAPSRTPEFYLAHAHHALQPGEAIASLDFSQSHGTVIVTAVPIGPGLLQTGASVRYYLDPLTGAVRDRSSADTGLMRYVHVLHGSLLLGVSGSRAVGLIAFLLLGSAASGLWLWWPAKGSLLRAMRWRRSGNLYANLHHQAGYWAVLPVIVLSLTGAAICFPGLFATAAGQEAATRDAFMRNVSVPSTRPRLELAQVLGAAGSPAPQTLVRIAWPTMLDSSWKISFRDHKPQAVVYIDDASGRSVSSETRPRTTVVELMRIVHDGTGLPLVWKIIIFATGLLGSALALTGLFMWLRGYVRR